MIHYWWIQKKLQIVDPLGPLNYTSTQISDPPKTIVHLCFGMHIETGIVFGFDLQPIISQKYTLVISNL